VVLVFYDRFTGTTLDTLILNDTVYTIIFQEGAILTTLREDTIERKVYERRYYYTHWDKEYLLYDFSLQVGDSIDLGNGYLYRLEVVEIESISGIIL